MIAILAVLGMLAPGVPVEISPPEPTVGDPVSIVFPEAPGGTVALAESDAYEIVSQEGNRAVIRSFRPGRVVVGGVVREPERSWAFPSLAIEIVSVLEGDEDLAPAPLRPPRELPPHRVAWGALAVALAAAAWLWFLVLRSPAAAAVAAAKPARSVAPARELLRDLDRAARLAPHDALVVVSGATRRFLSRVDPALTLDLTSRELRRELARRGLRVDLRETIDAVLRFGDLEKFSPAGARGADRDALIAGARQLADLAPGGER